MGLNGESMFIGEFKHKLDNKGRLTIPSIFREDLKDYFYLTRGMDGCLFLFTKEEFFEMSRKVNRLRITNKKSRGFARLFYSGAIQVSLDKQGRILIPPRLREYSNISSEVMVIGVFTRLELWDLNSWEEYNNDKIFNYDSLSEDVDEIDF